MSYFKLLSIVVLGLWPITAFSDPSMECSSFAPDTSQVGIGNCLAETQNAVDNTVEQTLDFAMQFAIEVDESSGRAFAVPALTKSQSEWVSYRDAHCEFVGTTFGGGSGAGIAIQSCRIELGRARAAELAKYLS